VSDVSVLGTGLMGAAIARTLLDQGRSVTVWNRSHDKTEALAAQGADVAPTATAALRASPVSIVVIFSYENVRAILEEAAAGGVTGDVVNVVTGSPAEADDLASWAAQTDLHVLDGALLTYPAGIGRSESLVFYSGDEGVWQRHQPLLQSIAGMSEYLGPQARLANAMDHVTLSFLTVAQTAAFSTLAYGEALGLPRSAVVGQIVGTLPTIGGYVQHAAEAIDAGELHTTEATIDTWVASSRGFAAGHRAVGLPGREITAAAHTIAAAADAGLGHLDLAAVYASELRASGRDAGGRRGTTTDDSGPPDPGASA
jgi:3-hydroxyisobutyrate dehydrogenase-like beta-hydroxyacid dehydrogenase